MFQLHFLIDYLLSDDFLNVFIIKGVVFVNKIVHVNANCITIANTLKRSKVKIARLLNSKN